jgi:hypothetical protein
MPQLRSKCARNSDRRFFIGGSDARIIMGSDQAALIQLWREKRGEANPEDLSGNLLVQLGAATKQLLPVGIATSGAATDQQRAKPAWEIQYGGDANAAAGRMAGVKPSF